ncbi:MAG: S8 family peptidase [Candidatus Pacebacteria bacterium]|nr:S8 family peptidase [Candidatus Paceibacterota bacterium]
MKNKYIITFSVVLSLILANGAYPAAYAKESDDDGESQKKEIRKIVVYEAHVDLEEAEQALKRKYRSAKTKKLGLVNGLAVSVDSEEEALFIGREKGVKSVDDDVIVQALAVSETLRVKGGSQPSENLPWGVGRIQADLVWPSGNTADPIKVAVIDTGISAAHPDLAGNIKGGYNAIDPSRSYNDDNGHGSHVAGIIAAVDNSIGVIGAAPASDLYAVKVLNKRGSGFVSDVIEGIQWAVANDMDVINMSLGSNYDIAALRDAIIAAYNSGIVVVAAAGNDGEAVDYPGAYPEVLAVGATDYGNNIASFSSRGPEVDLVAPGVSIFSTYKGSWYATMSGTSMAAPHVAGVAALLLNSPVGFYDFNGNGAWDPVEVYQKLEDSASDLGVTGYDNTFGWGLVNAYNAVNW